MTIKQFDNWVNKLGKAWMNKNPQSAADLFSEKVNYFETPFDEPITSKNEVRKLWEDVPKSQKDINFEYNILSIQRNTCISHFSASFTRIRSGKKAFLDGIFVFKLNENGICNDFRWWWNTKEK